MNRDSRLRQLNEQNYLKQQEEQDLAEKKLQELARIRGRQDPTSKWIHKSTAAVITPVYKFGSGYLEGNDSLFGDESAVASNK